MLDQVISALVSFIVEVISAAGYLGVVVLMAIESACIPLPSEIIMPFAGYLVSTGQFSLIGAATAGALGCNVGSTIAYVVAAKGGRAAIERWGAYVLVRPVEIDRAERFFTRYGAVTVFAGRLLTGGANLYRLSRGTGAHADDEIPDLFVSRLVAVVFRPRLRRVYPRRALEQRPDLAQDFPPIRCRRRGYLCGRLCLVPLDQMARDSPAWGLSEPPGGFASVAPVVPAIGFILPARLF